MCDYCSGKETMIKNEWSAQTYLTINGNSLELEIHNSCSAYDYSDVIYEDIYIKYCPFCARKLD